MDEYVDKVYEQFISEGGRAQRTVLKEERAKLKAESAAAAPRYRYWLFTSVGDPDQSPSRIRVRNRIRTDLLWLGSLDPDPHWGNKLDPEI